MNLDHPLLQIDFPCRPYALWRYRRAGSGLIHALAAPVFEVNGEPLLALPEHLQPLSAPRLLPNGCEEHTFGGAVMGKPRLSLHLILRLAPDSPVARFHYRLLSEGNERLTKTEGRDRLRYAGLSYAPMNQVTEIVLGEFHEMTHAYRLLERDIPTGAFQAGLTAIGPILAGTNGDESLLLAYEHGSTAPNTYLAYSLTEQPRMDSNAIGDAPPAGKWAELTAVKGNYAHRQALDPAHPYETIWMQIGAVHGGMDALANAYRHFILSRFSLSSASRQPLIFYNTWNFQERNRHWYGQSYLASMNEARLLAEIEVAHQIGVDVFVLDTGWYAKTGDWEVDRRRFPHGLEPICKKLEEYDMRLGLWFNPGAAAISSRLHAVYRDCAIWRGGKESEPQPVWETEPSRSFCLVSRYADAFAEQLIRLNRELGVTYFKWDAVGQENGCASPNHNHGGEENSESERADCYEFELARSLVKIAEKVNAACPDAICDLDMTESGRAMGLAFLSAGKYFLINNGPYFASYDLPTPGANENLFFYPGPARPTLCREALDYDRWIPAHLFLTHYFPDETPEPAPHWSLPHGRADSLEVNLASLILGHNGIWGDLLSLSPAGVQRIADTLSAYRRVARAMNVAAPLRSGKVGSSPEIHEKITQGQGAVVIFSPRCGSYAYVTHNPAGKPFWRSEGLFVRHDSQGRAILAAVFTRPGAKIVFFE